MLLIICIWVLIVSLKKNQHPNSFSIEQLMFFCSLGTTYVVCVVFFFIQNWKYIIIFAGKSPTDALLDEMMSAAPGPINFTMFLTMFGEKLNGTDPEDVIRNAFACFDTDGNGMFSRICVLLIWYTCSRIFYILYLCFTIEKNIIGRSLCCLFAAVFLSF